MIKMSKKRKRRKESIYDDVLFDADRILEDLGEDWEEDFYEGDPENEEVAAAIAAANPFSEMLTTGSDKEKVPEKLLVEKEQSFLNYKPEMDEELTRQKHQERMLEVLENRSNKIVEDADEKKSVRVKKQKSDAGYGFFEIERRVIEKNHIFCHNNELYFFNGRCYSKLNEKVLKAMIAQEMSEEQKNNLFFRRYRNDIMTSIKENASIDLQLNKIEPTQSVVTFRNGNLDLETGQLLKHSPDILTVYEVNANYIEELPYLPTPKWDSYGTSAMEGDSREVMHFLETILGYLLIPGAPAKKFFVFGTAPDSGKSVFGDLATFLLGEENVSGVELHEFQRNFMFSGIAGMVANIGMDLPDEIIQPKAVSRLKSVTGHDKIQMEKKHQQGFKIGVETKFVFGTNAPLKLKKHDAAFYKRMIVVPFMHSVPDEEQNWDLLDELKAERDFIVTKAMRAVMMLRENNYVFPVIEASARLHREWSKTDADIAVDTVEKFVSSWCIRTDDPTDFVTADVLFDCYSDFCDIYEYKTVQRTLFPQLMEKYFPKKRASYTENGVRSQPRGFQFVKLKIA